MGVFDISNRRRKKTIQETPEDERSSDHEQIEELSGEYEDTLNILTIDSHVKQMFADKKRQQERKKKELVKIEKSIANFSGFHIDRLVLLEKKKSLEEEVSVRLDDQMSEYTADSAPLLEKFKPLNVKYCVIKSSKKQGSDEEIENIKTEQRLKLIDSYLSIAKRYMNINFIRNFKHSQTLHCESCGEVIVNDDESICNCGLYLPVISKLTSFKETNRGSVSFGQVYYEDLKNFTKALHAFQGIQTSKDCSWMKRIFEELDEYFTGIGRQKGEFYRAQERLSSGKKKGTSFQDLILALDKTGNSEQYNNAHFIAKEYWGWKLLDLSEYEEQIIEDYNKVQRIWDKEKDRDSSPNVKIRLYLHLRARGIPVLREDFKFPVTSSCINYYNDRLKKIFEECGLHYENLI